MNFLSSVLLLLQLAAALISGVNNNPNATAEQKQAANDFAQKAISTALQAVADMDPSTVATTSAPAAASTTIIVQNPTPQIIYVYPPAPTSTGSTPAPAPIVAPTPTCSLSGTSAVQPGAQLPSVTLTWTTQNVSSPSGNLSRGNPSSQVTYQTIDTLSSSGGSRDHFQFAGVFKATFDGAACYAIFPNQDATTSVSTKPDSWGQVTL